MSENKNAPQKSSKNNQNKNTQKIKKSQKFYYKKKRTTKKTKKTPAPKKLNELPVRISFLGGINEVGKNITVFEYKNDILVVWKNENSICINVVKGFYKSFDRRVFTLTAVYNFICAKFFKNVNKSFACSNRY